MEFLIPRAILIIIFDSKFHKNQKIPKSAEKRHFLVTFSFTDKNGTKNNICICDSTSLLHSLAWRLTKMSAKKTLKAQPRSKHNPIHCQTFEQNYAREECLCYKGGNVGPVYMSSPDSPFRLFSPHSMAFLCDVLFPSLPNRHNF